MIKTYVSCGSGLGLDVFLEAFVSKPHDTSAKGFCILVCRQDFVAWILNKESRLYDVVNEVRVRIENCRFNWLDFSTD